MQITLTAWAEKRYCPSPSIRTLRAWNARGEIYPPAELVGRTLMVEENAVRVPKTKEPPEAANEDNMSPRARAIFHAILHAAA